jgi:GNAT superfamily N-acetyltransferase
MTEDAHIEPAPPSERVYVRSLTAPSSNEIGALAELFDLYRVHYGQAPDAAGSAGWLEQNLRSGRMNAFVADDNSRFVGFAVTVEIPASLRLAHFWQIRDLFVLPMHRRQGVGHALLDSVRAAATASGALRLALQTEEQNDPALALYISSGYIPMSGYRTLVLPID